MRVPKQAFVVPREEHETHPDARKMLKQSGRFAAVGLEMGIAIGLGILVGRYLDDYSSGGVGPAKEWIDYVLGRLRSGRGRYIGFVSGIILDRVVQVELLGAHHIEIAPGGSGGGSDCGAGVVLRCR